MRRLYRHLHDVPPWWGRIAIGIGLIWGLAVHPAHANISTTGNVRPPFDPGVTLILTIDALSMLA